MSEIMHGMGIASGILLPVVVLTVFCSMVAVRRGEAAMRGDVHGAAPGLHSYVPGAAGTATAATSKAEKPAAVIITEDPSVMEIILLGLALFTLTVLLLVGISFVSHL